MSEDTFRWVVTGGIALQTLCFVIAGVLALKLLGIVTKVGGKAEDAVKRLVPIIDNVREITRENTPKISGIATRAGEIAVNAKDISDVARDQAHRFAEVGKDIAARTQAQVARVDAAVDDTVDQVQNAGTNLKAAALKPVREATGVLAGVKAAVSTYAQGRRNGMDRATQDEEMFI